MITLRPYQARDVELIRQGFRRGVRRILYVLPTGGGKTICFSEIAMKGLAKGSRIMILVHRRELLMQASQKLRDFGVPHGLIAPGFQALPSFPIQVASVQSLARRMPAYPSPDLIIIDECHHLSAGSSWGKVVDSYPNASLLGVTATPLRLDGKGLGAYFDEMILGPDLAELTRSKYLTPAKYFAPTKVKALDSVSIQRGDYAQAELEAVMNRPSITGDAIAHYRRLAAGLPALAFCTSVKHARDVAREFREAGYRAESVDGEMREKERSSRIDALGKGSLDVLTNCALITEGTDVPGVAAGIILRPTASLGLHLQILGRMLRLAPGKDQAVILDHAGNCLRHGLADTRVQPVHQPVDVMRRVGVAHVIANDLEERSLFVVPGLDLSLFAGTSLLTDARIHGADLQWLGHAAFLMQPAA